MQAFVYLVLVNFLRVVTAFFFRSIEVVGLEHVPKDGPLIFTGNHPNSLVDPVVITTTCQRRVRFAARDGLFATPIRPILWALGSVPIKRRQDHAAEPQSDAKREAKAGEKQVDNQEAFSALHAVLKKGEAFGIFPEGVTYTEPELQPLKTGAARIALSAFAEGIPVRVVPVGLHYRRRDRFRGRVLVQFGRPITLDATWMAQWASDARETSRKLTQEIELGLRALTLNARDFDMYDYNWWADLDPDETITPEFRTGEAWNYPGWSNKRFDELVTSAQNTLDVSKRQVFYKEACDILMDEAPIGIVAHMPVFKVFSQKVKDFKYIPVDSMNLHTVSLA